MISLLFVAAQLQLTGLPEATIGAVDGDTTEILSNIASVLVDRREHVYVFQRLVPYIAVFDRDGKRVATLGRPGGGPGEFALPTRIAFHQDSIWVADASLGKLALFAPDFSHVRDVVVAHAFPDLLKVPARLVPLGATGSGVIIEARVADDVITLHQSWSGSGARELFRIRRQDVTRILQVAGRAITIIRPILEHPFLMVAGDGYVRVERSVDVSLTAHGPDGTILRRLEVGLEPAPVSRAYIETILDEQVERLKAIVPSASRGRLRRELQAAIDAPDESFFIEGALACASCGTIWLRQAIPGRTPVLIEVDVGTGRIGRTIEEREGEKVMAVGDGYVWVLRLDEDDVPFLHRLELH